MKVSVLVVTYNHERYIAQALESVAVQDADFPYEILISEDCSTDGTRDIVRAFAARHPERVRLLLSERNVRSNEVVARGIRAARGEYIALLDGDDYWTAADKLRTQAAWLDAHPECAICFHDALVVRADGTGEPWHWTPRRQKEISTLEDLWYGNFIATCSTMFRRGLIGDIPSWYDALFPITDWPLHILNAEHGCIGYIDRVLGVYRYHEGGLYSPLDEAEKLDRMLAFYRAMDRNLGYRHTRIIERAISKYFFGWAAAYAARGEIGRARRCFGICLSGRPISPAIDVKSLVRLGLKLYVPGLR